jgi:23S rRNA pseudouridine1911/1915/1917 synthase
VIRITLKYIVKELDNNIKIKFILKNRLLISDRLLIKLKLFNKIYCNGKNVFANYIVKQNDVVEVVIDFEEEDNIKAQKMDLDIIYEDEYMIAINKPAGIVVHPSLLHQDNTLANGLKYYLSNKKKIRPINRLDRDTSGIVLFAKNEYIQEQIGVHTNVSKEYIAIVEGILNPPFGTIDAPIARKDGSIIERCISQSGQYAITKYELLYSINDISIIRLVLITGRTHQIRVHMKHIGNPIIGDTLYGNESKLIDRQALHAYKIEFIHPISKEIITIIANLPKDMKEIAKDLPL